MSKRPKEVTPMNKIISITTIILLFCVLVTNIILINKLNDARDLVHYNIGQTSDIKDMLRRTNPSL